MRASWLGRIKEIYLMPFRAIPAALKMFSRNRARVRDFIGRPQVAKALKYGMMITLLMWFAVALLNSGKDKRLTEAIDELWSNPTSKESYPAATGQ